MRASLAGAAALLAVLLAACGAGPPGGPFRPPPAPAPAASGPELPEELRISNPLDVRGIPPCELLTPAQLREVGLDPSSGTPWVRQPGGGCLWKWQDGSTQAYVGANGDPGAIKLDSVFRNRDLYHNFTAFRISGYPALRVDPDPTGSCLLQVGAADDHVLEISAYGDSRVVPEPCAMAVRMAEMVLSNLPPLR